MMTINMDEYGQPHPANPDIRFYLTLEEGRKAAEDCQLKQAVNNGMVNILIKESRELGIWTSRIRDNVQAAWVKGFVGPTAREVGITLFLDRVRFNDAKLTEDTWYSRGRVGQTVREYLLAEEKRLEKASEAAARKTGNTTWTLPGQLLIPDIGTVLRLNSDWSFRLFEESRNEAFLKRMGVDDVDCWRQYQDGGKMRQFEVTIMAGAEMAVDRVYIRKGADDYSSLTFNLHKGGMVTLLGKTLKGNGRFWAKLSDVNKMKVEIDTNTLAVN